MSSLELFIRNFVSILQIWEWNGSKWAEARAAFKLNENNPFPVRKTYMRNI